MNREQVVDLLALAAACDQRTVGEADLAAWHMIVGPLDYAAALDALRQHYRRQPDVRLKPGHLWQMCATRTDVEAATSSLDQTCEHGSICWKCKLVHWPDEPCEVLTERPWPVALEAVAQVVPGEVPA